MKKIIYKKKQSRVRCSDEDFLKAVYSSKTYKEISQKTGQKIASTIARYIRMKQALIGEGIILPEIKRAKNKKEIKNLHKMKTLAGKLNIC